MGLVVISGCFEPPITTTNKIYIYPQISYKIVDDMFNVSIRLDSQQAINGFETSFKFNQSLVQIVNWEWGDYFPSESFRSIPRIDNVNGIVTGIFAVSIGTEGIKSASTVIKFTFVSDLSGNCELELYDTNIVNSTGKVPFELTNGQIIVSG